MVCFLRSPCSRTSKSTWTLRYSEETKPTGKSEKYEDTTNVFVRTRSVRVKLEQTKYLSVSEPATFWVRTRLGSDMEP